MSSDRAKEGQKRRSARRRETLAERGIKPVTLIVPEIVHPPLKAAAKRMKDGEDPFAALRSAAGINAPPDTAQAQEQIAAVTRERDAELLTRQQAERERDEARGELEGVRAQIGQMETERDNAISEVGEWKQRAGDAEGVIARAQSAKGLIPWLARYMLSIPEPSRKPRKTKQKP